MAFNLCHPMFQARIHCDKPSVDGYDVTNLLSSNSRLLNAGFMTESFARTPVTIVIEFPFNVDLKSVRIHSKVGCQISSGFEIFSHAAKRPNCWLLDDPYKSAVDLPKTFYNDRSFRSLGKAGDNTKQYFMFNNSQFYSHPPYDELAIMQGHQVFDDNLVAHRNLKFQGKGSLNWVSDIAIKIIFNTPGSTSAVRWIEVWGQPSSSCLPRVRNHVLALHRDYMHTLSAQYSKNTEENETNNQNINPKASTDVRSSIPDEFQDPITVELMALPVLLPSGYTVDQLTLDRHTQEESKWGRPPNDPFTGVPFTESKRPLPNTILKTRIDAFVLKNSSLLGNISRTIGSKEDPSGTSMTISTLVQKKHGQNSINVSQRDSLTSPSTSRMPKLNEDGLGDTCVGKQKTVDTNKHASTIMKRKLEAPTSESVESKKRYTVEDLDSGTHRSHSSENSMNLSSNCGHSNGIGNTNSKMKASSLISHEELLKSSLDLELSSTLSSLPSFRRYAPQSVPRQPSSTCIKCEELNRSASQLYVMSCLHKICKSCLLSVKIEGTSFYCCPECDKRTLSKDVTKLQ